MSINLPDLKKKKIVFRRGDIVRKKAQSFCSKHGLEEAAEVYLCTLLEAKRVESLRELKSPNELISSIAYPNKPGAAKSPSPRSPKKEVLAVSKEIESRADENDDGSLHGNQTQKFNQLLAEKFHGREEKEDNPLEEEAELDIECRINNGHKIHMRGIKKHEKQIKKDIHAKRTEEAKKNDENYSFRPKLNKNSRRIVQEKKNESNLSFKNKDLDLYNQARWLKEKKDQLKVLYESQEMMECTFRPKINQM